MLRVLIILLGGALFVVALISSLRREAQQPFVRLEPRVAEAQTTLLKLWPLPDFSLTERTGQPVTLADLKGKVWVADFFYTTCPGPCPMLTSRLSHVHKSLAAEPGVRVVSVSTDPEKDTPEVLRSYAERFGASERWLFLTGEKAAIHRLANDGFKLALAEDPAAREPITHSTRLALVDRDGIVRGFYEGTGDEGPERIIRDARRLLAEQP